MIADEKEIEGFIFPVNTIGIDCVVNFRYILVTIFSADDNNINVNKEKLRNQEIQWRI